VTYDLQGQNGGSRFACRSCGNLLSIESSGLRLISPTPPAPPASAPPLPAANGTAALTANTQLLNQAAVQEATAQAKAQAQAMAAELAVRMRRVADWPTWLFGGGLALLLCAMFFPLLDRASVDRLEAKIVAGDVRQERIAANLARQTDASEADKARVEKGKAAWLDTKNDWEEDFEYAELKCRSNAYWYRWGTLAGYGLLILGSFGFLDSRQQLLVRIIGATVLIATAVAVLNSLGGFGVRLELG
jgi:hypothetical protein